MQCFYLILSGLNSRYIQINSSVIDIFRGARIFVRTMSKRVHDAWFWEKKPTKTKQKTKKKNQNNPILPNLFPQPFQMAGATVSFPCIEVN